MENCSSPPRSRMARAVATARSASFSCAWGTPKSAMRQSPMYLSTVPPCSTTTSAMRRKARSTVRATTSGSVFSDMAVNPTTSAKRTVTSLRSPPGSGVESVTGSGSAAWSAEPQRPQKRWSGGFGKPQSEHHPPPRAWPHAPQKREPTGLSAPHWAHRRFAAMVGISESHPRCRGGDPLRSRSPLRGTHRWGGWRRASCRRPRCPGGSPGRRRAPAAGRVRRAPGAGLRGGRR